MLDLERLRALHAVSRFGTVSAAADALHVTSSAVSQQLAKLERETGQTLLERNGRGIRLTDAAELLAGHADKILCLVEEASADLEAHRGVVVGELTVASFPTAMRGLGPSALSWLREHHPELRVTMRESDPAESVPLVQRGDLDLAIVQDWSNQPIQIPTGLARGTICEDIADVMLPAAHPLAHREWVELRELCTESWISSTPDSVCFGWLSHTLRTAGLEPRIDHMAYEYRTQMAFVAAGLCAGILPRLGCTGVPDTVKVVGLRPLLTRRIYAVWRAGAARRPAIRATLAALRQAVPEAAPGIA